MKREVLESPGTMIKEMKEASRQQIVEWLKSPVRERRKVAEMEIWQRPLYNEGLFNTIKTYVRGFSHDSAIHIFLAVEAGSRAWGFESPDSDFDIRFIYGRPLPSYLKLDPKDDTMRHEISLKDGESIDMVGWDIMKALRLFRNWNPAIMEWLHSPIIYKEKTEFAPKLRELASEQVNAEKQMHHYLGIADKHFKEFVEGKDKIQVKKYLYALRHILACAWVDVYNEVPPVIFDVLRKEIHAITRDRYEKEFCRELRDDIESLIQQKMSVEESHLTEPYERINTFIKSEIEHFKAYMRKIQFNYQFDPTPMLNKLFLDSLGDTGLSWGRVYYG